MPNTLLFMINKHTALFVLLSILSIVFFILDISFGSVNIPLSDSMNILWGGNIEHPIAREILLNIRLPKALTAIIAGVGLSLSGMMMQTLFRNALAGPYILGVSSGASLGVAIVILAGGILGFIGMSSWITIIAAIVGAIAVLMVVILLSQKVQNNVSLLIIGMMFGSAAGAIVSVMQNFSNPDALKLFIVWTLGSLSSVGWEEMWLLLPMSLLGVFLCFATTKPLNGLLLGENYARGLGIDVNRTRLTIILSTALLAGGITAFTGPIAFVGVAIPHIARGLFGTSNHRIIIPASALCGACLMLACDVISQAFTHPLPISTVTSLFGAPIIIWIVIRKKGL